MIEHFSIQTRFKHPYKRSSNSLATHTPYNPRRRLKTPEASERLTGLRAGAEAEREYHLPAQAWNKLVASLRSESSRTRRTSQRRRETPETSANEFCGTSSGGKATAFAARGAP